MELFIKNALVIDGTGSSAFRANLGIKQDKIAYIGKENLKAKRTIDARQMILTPGFIDSHSHSDFTILADPRAEGKITQGITTEINGNCGLSAFPMYGEFLKRRIHELNQLGLNYWNNIEEYINLLKNKKPILNFATLCGHGNLRASLVGYKNTTVDKQHLDEMKKLLKKQFSYKIRGLSTGLIYPPGIFATTEELIDLTKVIKPFRGVYVTHLRSEGERLFSAVEEAIIIGRKAEVEVHISHLKTSGRENWWKIEPLLSIIENAQKEGIKITADRYPYTASETDLDAFLPSWIIEGDRDEIINRLENKNIRKKILTHIKEKGEKFLDNLVISSVSNQKHKIYEGKSLAELINLKDASDFICDLLISSNLYVGVIYFGMSEENLEKILSKPYVMIGTDSAARCSTGITSKGKPHPRGFGSFPRFIRKYVLEKRVLSLEEAVRKITSLPAKTFKIQKRGLIKEGYYADLVLFDINEIEDRATYKEPFKISKGIKYVIVNGTITVDNGYITEKRNGRILL